MDGQSEGLEKKRDVFIMSSVSREKIKWHDRLEEFCNWLPTMTIKEIRFLDELLAYEMEMRYGYY